MFGRNLQRVGTELNDTLRRELSMVRAEFESTMQRSLATLRTERAEVEAARAALERDRDEHLVGAMEQLTESMEMLASLWREERTHRAREIELLEFLVRERIVANAAPVEGPTVLGGIIDPEGITTVDVRDRATSLPTDTRPEIGMPVEVRSQFDDRWSNGFEILELVECSDTTRYRLVRQSDRAVIPILFGPDEIRRVSAIDLERLVQVSELHARHGHADVERA